MRFEGRSSCIRRTSRRSVSKNYHIVNYAAVSIPSRFQSRCNTGTIAIAVFRSILLTLGFFHFSRRCVIWAFTREFSVIWRGKDATERIINEQYDDGHNQNTPCLATTFEWHFWQIQWLSAHLHLLRQDRPRDFFSRDTTLDTSSVVRSDGLRFALFLSLSSDGGIVVGCREFVGSHCYDSVNNIW